MTEDLFKGIVQWSVTLGGREGRLPVFYRDLSSLTVVWTASTREVARRLPHPDMRLLELYPGRCVVAFSAFEYRDCDIGPYNELSIAFPIAFGRRALPGFSLANAVRERRLPAYVWKLPVTTEIARAGGVDLYGLPKFLADIKLERRGSDVECRLAAEGRDILSFSARFPAPSKARTTRMAIYSMKDGQPVVANVVMQNLENGETARPDAELKLLPGELGDELKAMEVGGRPLLAVWAPKARAILFGPRNIIDD